MSIFGKRKVPVHVSGSRTTSAGADGRYGKQARQNRKLAKQKIRNLPLEPKTPAELRGYIEHKYGVGELERTDERYMRAFMGIKAHLVYQNAPELLKTKAVPEPDHPPLSENDPDYALYRETEEKRWHEAVMLPADKFAIRLHVYNIPIMQGDVPVSWLEVYVESKYEYLAFKNVTLEYEEHYLVDRVIADIVNYFGAGEADKKAKNERYVQYCSVQ